jgi:hypothetical protein
MLAQQKLKGAAIASIIMIVDNTPIHQLPKETVQSMVLSLVTLGFAQEAKLLALEALQPDA